MELRRLKSFTMVAETLHFGRAAQRLRIAQPALTQQIQQLENELGTKLLDRDRRSVRLTPVGALFLVEARKVMAHVERATLVAERARRGELGQIEISHVSSIAYSGILSRVIVDFQQGAPDVTLNVRELDLEPQLADLSDGRLDVAFIRLPAGLLPETIRAYTICREPVLVCLRRDHPLANGPVNPADLAGEPILATHLREGFGFYDTMLKVCSAAGFAPRIAGRSRQFATIVSLVAAGRGVGLVPEPVRRLAIPEVVYQPLIGGNACSEVAILYRENESHPAVLRFIEHCKQVLDGCH